jgi:hypothetical protein
VVGHVEERSQRRQPDQLRFGQLDAVLGGFGPDRLPDPPQRGCSEVEDVHRDLGAIELLDEEAVALDLRQAPARLADAPGDPDREVLVGRVEVDVVGDEERAGADGDRSGSRVHPGRPEVRLAAALGDLGTESLVLPAPDVGQLDPFRSQRRRGVEIDRQMVTLRNPPAEAPGEHDRLVHGRVGQGHERDDVDRPDPRMLAPVALHVDLLDRRSDEPIERVGDGPGRASQREHGAVVAGVARPIEEMDLRDRGDGGRQSFDDVETPTFGDVRDRFDQSVGEVRHRPIVTGRRLRRGRQGWPCCL